jgi:hypothetical protein
VPEDACQAGFTTSLLRVDAPTCEYKQNLPYVPIDESRGFTAESDK